MLCLKIQFRFFEKNEIFYRKTMMLVGMVDFCPPALGREYWKALQHSNIPIFQTSSSKLKAQLLGLQ